MKKVICNKLKSTLCILLSALFVFALTENFAVICAKAEETTLVPTGIAGDINADGAVNGKDFLRARKYFSGWDVEADKTALDANGDGEVNGKDFLRLRKFFSGWDVEIYYGKQSEPTHTHSFSEWTYKNEKKHSRTCSCSVEETELHCWNEGEIIKEATTTEAGTKKYTCSVCKGTKEEDYTLEEEESTPSYLVTFLDYDNSIIKTEIVVEGSSATCTAPEHEGYKFGHWEKSGETNPLSKTESVTVSDIQEDTVIRAVYAKTYTVEFLDKDGNTVEFLDKDGNHREAIYENVVENSSLKALENETKVPEETGYDGKWDNEFEYLTSDLQIKPVYTAKKYTVKFVFPDETVVTQQVDYGSVPDFPELPDGYEFDWKNMQAFGYSDWKKTNKTTENEDNNIIYGDTIYTTTCDAIYGTPVIAVEYNIDKDNKTVNPAIYLCNLNDYKLYGLNFTLTYKTGKEADNQTIKISSVETNDSADWLKSENKDSYDCEINNKTREMNFAWVNANGVSFDDCSDFIKSVNMATHGILYTETGIQTIKNSIKIDEESCSMVIRKDGGATFEKITPVIVYR